MTNVWWSLRERIHVDKAEASCVYSIHTRLVLNFCPGLLGILSGRALDTWHAQYHTQATFSLSVFASYLSSACLLVSRALPLVSTYVVKRCHLLCSNQTHMVWLVSMPAAHRAAHAFGCESKCHHGSLLCSCCARRTKVWPSKLWACDLLNQSILLHLCQTLYMSTSWETFTL